MTVFGRSTLNTGRKQGDMGVFIKSVVPGGAAALVRGREGGREREREHMYCNVLYRCVGAFEQGLNY